MLAEVLSKPKQHYIELSGSESVYLVSVFTIKISRL
jgi:hypothetical protein